MARKRDPVPADKRKRALSSCDRCKLKKRGCHRFANGQKRFDINIPCQNCIKAKAECITSLPRKKKKVLPVAENTFKQISYYTSIIKAMFPENDPTDVDHLKKIGDALFISLPDINSINTFNLSSGLRAHDDMDDDMDDGIDNGVDVHGSVNDTNQHEHDNHNSPLDIENSTYENQNNNPSIGMHNSNSSSNSSSTTTLLKKQKSGIGSADLLFNTLLKIGDVNAEEKINSSESNKQTSFPILNYDNNIHVSLILDLIPPQECEMYTNIFFNKLHQSYFIFDENKFRLRQKLYLLHLKNKESLNNDNFCNEEICTMYLVWILGRNCYLTKLLQVDDPSEANTASNSIIAQYWEMVKLFLSYCLFAKNVHSVRMLYLISLHFSTLKDRDSAWITLTNACLKCVQLGYCQESHVIKFDEPLQEEIRIAWWSSFKLHMNNCAIMGRLPNISLYDVDLKLPMLENIEDKLFRDVYTKSMELFKIMFIILKNREYLTKSRNPWCKENLSNVSKINNSLKIWKMGIGYSLEYYKRPNPKRYQIKLHLQYYYCILSLLAPYLIAFSLKPKNVFVANENIITTLCSGVDSAIKLMQVITFSVNTNNFTGLLHYDLFYAYNSLMILLLGYILIKETENGLKNENHIKFKLILSNTFEINADDILASIKEIKDINNLYGSQSVGTMKGFSNNITVLLNYFKLNNQATEPLKTTPILFDTKFDDSITRPFEAQIVNNGSDLSNFYDNTNSMMVMNENENKNENNKFINNNTNTASNLYQMEKGFYDFINFINSEQDSSQQIFSDQLLLDWNKLFGTPEMTLNGACDHQF